MKNVDNEHMGKIKMKRGREMEKESEDAGVWEDSGRRR